MSIKNSIEQIESEITNVIDDLKKSLKFNESVDEFIEDIENAISALEDINNEI